MNAHALYQEYLDSQLVGTVDTEEYSEYTEEEWVALGMNIPSQEFDAWWDQLMGRRNDNVRRDSGESPFPA